MMQIFISSVQRELADERQALQRFIEGDALLRRFFKVFLFESLPACDRRADETYLAEVRQSEIYLGIFGTEYGAPDEHGRSPTEREYRHATEFGKIRLVYVKGASDIPRHPGMAALIQKADESLIRRRFATLPELIASVYASLVQVLVDKELIRMGPFDATHCPRSTLDDLDEKKIRWFVELARRARGFSLPADSSLHDVLTHLNLLDEQRPTHAAILLFGKQPQRFLLSSEVKCAHFHGIAVEKPIPSYQVYKGNVFELVDQALDFVLSKISRWVGTRQDSPQAPTRYEFPREVLAEAIVNAVAHRDYTSHASVQVMLFQDRLEIWNPGTLPPSLTVESLRNPHASIPANPLLAESLYLAKYIERMGTGIQDMIRRCRAAGLSEPDIRLEPGFFILTLWRSARPAIAVEASQKGPQSGLSREQVVVLRNCMTPKPLRELSSLVGRSNRTKFREQVLNPLLEAGWLERTIPDKPRSSKQQYRLTARGSALVQQMETLPDG